MNSVRNIHLPIRLRNFKKLAQFGEFLSRTVPCRGITNCLVFRGGIGQLKRQGRCTLSSSLILNSDVRVMLTIPMTRSSALHARSYATEQRSKNSPRRYYDVLEISPKANQAQIKAAYFRLSKLYHPDINKSKDAVEKFAEISEAHEILSKATTRKMYDRGIIDPRDPRSTHRSTHYWNSQTGQATREGAQNKPRRPPPTGKTPVYDYDEWLRSHYTDTRNRRKWERIHANVMDHLDEEVQRARETSTSTHVYVLFIFIFLVLLFLGDKYLHPVYHHFGKNKNLEPNTKERKEKKWT